MKKLVLCVMTASMLLLFNSTQSKAATETNPVSTTMATTIQAEEPNADGVKLKEIKAIDMSTLGSSENKEMLKEVSSVKNDQGRHGRGYERRNRNRDVDVTVRSDNQGYYNQGYHSHSTAYIGGGGLLLLILILILVL